MLKAQNNNSINNSIIQFLFFRKEIFSLFFSTDQSSIIENVYEEAHIGDIELY